MLFGSISITVISLLNVSAVAPFPVAAAVIFAVPVELSVKGKSPGEQYFRQRKGRTLNSEEARKGSKKAKDSESSNKKK